MNGIKKLDITDSEYPEILKLIKAPADFTLLFRKYRASVKQMYIYCRREKGYRVRS